MKPIRTWILIANNGRARIVENVGPGKGLHQPPGKTHTAEAASEFPDQPGRTFSRFGTGRSKMEHHQKRQTPRDGFAGELIDELIKSRRSDLFDRLIICAPPPMLGQMRELLPDELKSDLVAELPKDLTHISTHNLSDHFANFLAV